MFVVWEKWVETETDCYIDPSSSLTIAAILPHLGSVAQPWVTEDPKPSVWNWFSFRHLVSKTSSGLKDSDIIHKILEQATPFFPLFINLELQSENTGHCNPSTNPWDGEFLYRITSYRMPKTICNTTWMNFCPNLESANDSLENRNLKTKYFLFQENLIFRKI